MPYARSIARFYARNWLRRVAGAVAPDLEQEAYRALMAAVVDWDSARGSFEACRNVYIHQRVRKVVERIKLANVEDSKEIDDYGYVRHVGVSSVNPTYWTERGTNRHEHWHPLDEEEDLNTDGRDGFKLEWRARRELPAVLVDRFGYSRTRASRATDWFLDLTSGRRTAVSIAAAEGVSHQLITATCRQILRGCRDWLTDAATTGPLHARPPLTGR